MLTKQVGSVLKSFYVSGAGAPINGIYEYDPETRLKSDVTLAAAHTVHLKP